MAMGFTDRMWTVLEYACYPMYFGELQRVIWAEDREKPVNIRPEPPKTPKTSTNIITRCRSFGETERTLIQAFTPATDIDGGRVTRVIEWTLLGGQSPRRAMPTPLQKELAMLFRVAVLKAIGQSDLPEADRRLLLRYALFPRVHGVVDGTCRMVDMMEEAEAEMTKTAVAEGLALLGQALIGANCSVGSMQENLPQIMAS